MWAGLLGTRGGGAAVGDWLPPAVKHQLLDGLQGSRAVYTDLQGFYRDNKYDLNCCNLDKDKTEGVKLNTNC